MHYAMHEAPERLRSLVDQRASAPVPAAIDAVSETLAQRFGKGVVAVIAYGACLRQADPAEGLIDLYVIVDDYPSAYRHRGLRLANRLLPPNVFYLERSLRGRTLRAKYAVLDRTHLAAAIRRWCHPAVWGRFAQPVHLVYTRDRAIHAEMVGLLAEAALRLIRETAPMLNGRFSAGQLWQRGLALSYATELRPEPTSRTRELIAADSDHYQALTAAAQPSLAPMLHWVGPADRFRYLGSPRERRLRSLVWALRRGQGAVLSILRLAKASATFQGGVDYAVWKVERHTGKTVPVSDRLRRHPLIFGWPVLWRLLRRRILR